MDIEIWKPVPGYGDLYSASTLGRLRRKPRTVHKFCAMRNCMVTQVYGELILKPSPGKWGHLRVGVCVDHKRINLPVHQAVLLAFVGRCPAGLECCHGDGDSSNNKPSNLRWDTNLANGQDRKAHGRYAVGEAHHAASITIDKARAIKSASSHVEAAKQEGVSYKVAWRIRTGQTWADAL